MFRPSSLTSVIASLAHLGHHPGEAWAQAVLSALSPALEATARLTEGTGAPRLTEIGGAGSADLDLDGIAERENNEQIGSSSGQGQRHDRILPGDTTPMDTTFGGPGLQRHISAVVSPASPTPSLAVSACDAIAMSQLLWGLGKLGHRHLDGRWVGRLLVPALEARLPEMNAQGVSNSIWGECWEDRLSLGAYGILKHTSAHGILKHTRAHGILKHTSA